MGQIIKIALNRADHLQIAEVQVFGIPDSKLPSACPTARRFYEVDLIDAFDARDPNKRASTTTPSQQAAPNLRLETPQAREDNVIERAIQSSSLIPFASLNRTAQRSAVGSHNGRIPLPRINVAP